MLFLHYHRLVNYRQLVKLPTLIVGVTLKPSPHVGRLRWLGIATITMLPCLCNADTESAKEVTESPLRVVPLITSTPLTGTGVGAAASYLYRLDEGSSMSQMQVGAQYSNTDSVTVFVRNNAFFRDNRFISNTAVLPSKTNSEFDDSDGDEVKYQIKTFLIDQKLLTEFRDDIYLGGRITYKNLKYSANNQAGKDFIYDNGIVDEESVGLGAAMSFDSRKNKYFPRQAHWVDVDLTAYPSTLGAEESYSQAILNARYYSAGVNEGDVWASQFFGHYASSKTPDSSLPTLSGKSMLRGFPAGQFKARFLTGVQTEYRYQLVDTPFRLIAFIGAAQLDGGSYGSDGRTRDDDGWYSAAGIGARYAIQRRTGVDLRFDIVTTSENEESVYLTLNQAF
jgi:hypothetical protein